MTRAAAVAARTAIFLFAAARVTSGVAGKNLLHPRAFDSWDAFHSVSPPARVVGALDAASLVSFGRNRSRRGRRSARGQAGRVPGADDRSRYYSWRDQQQGWRSVIPCVKNRNGRAVDNLGYKCLPSLIIIGYMKAGTTGPRPRA